MSSCLRQRTFTDSHISTLFLIETGSRSVDQAGFKLPAPPLRCWHHRLVLPHPAKTSSLTLSGVLICTNVFTMNAHPILNNTDIYNYTFTLISPVPLYPACHRCHSSYSCKSMYKYKYPCVVTCIIISNTVRATKIFKKLLFLSSLILLLIYHFLLLTCLVRQTNRHSCLDLPLPETGHFLFAFDVSWTQNPAL